MSVSYYDKEGIKTYKHFPSIKDFQTFIKNNYIFGMEQIVC
jgi:hypothetical protein